MSTLFCTSSRTVVGVVGLSLMFIALLGIFAIGPTDRAAAFLIPDEGQAASPNRTQDVITIPQDDNLVTVDGVCDVNTEYSDAISFQFNEDTISGTVYLKQEATHLFVCMEGARGTDPRRFTSIYLDTDNGREKWAEGDDYSLRVDIITGTESSWVGTGVPNGYTGVILDGWTAVTNLGSGDYDVAEYKIPIVLTGGICNAPFGIAVYHHWLAYTGNDYGWPSNQWFDQPQTWQTARFAAAPCPSADLSFTKYDDPDPVAGGALLTYTLVVDNGAGPDTAFSIKLTDTLPAEVTFIPDMSDERCTEAYGTVTCDLGDLDQGWNTTIYIVVIPPPSGGTLTNSAIVTAKSADGKPGNNTATAVTTVDPMPTWADLAVSKSDAPDPVVAGAPLTYTIVVNNDGPYSAPNVIVNDTLPLGVNALTYPPYCALAGQNMTCALGDLASKADATVVIVVSPKGGGNIVNTVTVGSDILDPDTTNNTATASTTVTPRPADLSVSKTDAPDPVTAGNLLTYIITINNVGPGLAASVRLTDTLTPAATFVSATPAGQCNHSSGTVTCNVGNLSSGGSAVVRLVFRPTAVGELYNQVRVGAAAPDPNLSNNVDTEYTVVRPPLLPDITIYGLEITQGIQNLTSDMPLVANRDTRARGYARTTGSDLPNVRARLWASRGGVNLPHSPVETMWPPTPVHPGGANRLNARDAFFFYIWPEWRSGTVTFRLEVNYDHAVAESNYTNNTWEKTVTFHPANALNVVMINSWVGGWSYGFFDSPTYPIINSLHRHHPIADLGVWRSNLTVVVDAPYSNDDILDEVRDVDFWTSDPVAGVHYVGMINTNVQAANGQGECPGNDLWVRMFPPVGGWPAWVYNGGATLSHEMGHNKGIGHVYCGARDFIDPQPYPWPDPNCALAARDPAGYYGLDVQHGRWGLPSAEVISNDNTAAPPHRAFPIMGYTWPRWTSPWEWCRLLRAYNVPCNLYASVQSAQEVLQEAVMANPAAYANPTEVAALRSASPYLRASGVITLSTGTARFQRVTQLSNPLQDAVEKQVEQMGYRQAFGFKGAASEPYTLVQVDATDKVLASNEILLNMSCDGAACDAQHFAELVPYASGATKVQVRQGATVLAERIASANPPAITLLAPNGGGTVGIGTVVQWSASDADGDPLTFNILYSRDNGATWLPVALNVTGTTYLISSTLPGATQGLMRLVAMDGFHSTEDVSDGTFTVAGNAPLAAIVAPFAGMAALPGSPVEFKGTATDLEDGPLSDGQLTWTSDRDGALGAGEVIALDTLSPGWHQITLTATDSDGQTYSQTIALFIGHRLFLPLVLKQ